MSSINSWDSGNPQVLRSYNPNPIMPQIGATNRGVPALPPRPGNLPLASSYTSPYSPYSGGYGTYGSMAYRSPMYGGYGFGNSYGYGSSYGGYGSYGMYGGTDMMPRDDAERRFISFAEESSRNTFANVESVVRAFNSIAMMLDNTFFAMTSSFRAVLSVAENFGRLRSMFGHIWYTVNVFRLFKWLYRKLMETMGYKVTRSAASHAWNEVYQGANAEAAATSGGSSWPTLAFLGILMSAPYFISKFLLPKYEDKCDPEKWKSPGITAKAAFDFAATSSNELSLRVNDDILIAPTYIQEEMKLTNSGWAFATCRGRSGLIPLNYVIFTKRVNGGGVLKKNSDQDLPVPREAAVKRVSFGENQIIESNGTERIVKIPDMEHDKEAEEETITAPVTD